MSHPEQNPCITKQLDQKAVVMQRGSNALPTYCGGGEKRREGDRVSGKEEPGNLRGSRGGGRIA